MKFYAPKYKQLDLGLLRSSLDELDKTNREDIQHAFINHQIKRNVFGMNPILAALQTAEIAVNEIGLKRDGIIAILLSLIHI